MKILRRNAPVYGMSVPRNVELDEIKNHSYLLVLHLAKLFMFPYEDWSNHWKGEIRAHLGKTRRIRPKNKFLPAEDIVDAILSTVNLDTIILAAKSAVDEKPPINTDTAEIKEGILDYLSWAANGLSQSGGLSMSQVDRKLDEIIESL